MNVAAINATSPFGASHAAELAAAAPTHSKAKSLSGAALRNASPEQQRVEVAAQFEAILVRQLLGPTMTAMLGKEGGAASNVYGDMLTSTFSDQLTSGGGLGLGRMLQQQLAPRAPHAATTSPAANAAP